MAVPVSGCSITGTSYYQNPVESAGWSISWSTDYQSNRSVPTAEFACGAYKYQVAHIFVSDSYWYGPPLIPLIPHAPETSGEGREYEVIMAGDLASTLSCPVIKLDGQEYKALDLPHKDSKTCRYTIRIPARQDRVSLSMADQTGCAVTPLNFKLTPLSYYYPLFPPRWYSAARSYSRGDARMAR